MQIKKLLIIGKVWPEPNSSAAGKRMMQLIQLFLENNYEIHFATTAGITGNEVKLSKIKVITHFIMLNDDGFDEFLKQLSPDIVMYDRFMTEEQFGWRVRSVLPKAVTLLDTEDLHFLRKGREEGVKKRGEFEQSDYFNDTTKRELASILRTDLTLIISTFEMDLLKDLFLIPASKLFYLPILEKTAEKIVPFDERRDIVFIGNFMHEPNWDAVLQLKKIWKNWSNKPKEIKLKVYGAYPPQKAFQLNSEKEQFQIIGRADSSLEVIGNARLLVAPLRFGAGLKGKLIEAMSLGTPTITTSVGAEGLAGIDDWGGAVEDDLGKWTAVIQNLFENKDSWLNAQSRGFENLANISKFELLQQLIDRVNELVENVMKHRQANYLGEVLHYHTLRSTEYMSKWIAEKNK